MSGTLLGRLGRAPTEIAVPLGFILSLLLLAGVGIASARSIGYLRESFLLVDHSRQVLTRLADLAAALRAAESAQRGFVISGNDEFLAHFEEDAGLAVALQTELAALTVDNPRQQESLAELRGLVSERVQYSREVIDVRRQQDRGAAEQRIAAGTGTRLQARIEDGIERMRLHEDGLLAERRRVSERMADRAMTLILSVGALAVLLLALAYARIRADLAQRVRNRRSLQEANASLDVARRRAEAADQAKSAFLAAMSHELRTPLNSIIGFTSILAQGKAGPVNEVQAKQLGIVQNSSRHLLALINDILDLSRIEAGELTLRPAAFDPARSIAKTVDTIRPLAERKGLALEAVVPPDLPAGFGDERRFEQVLLNLLTNGVKFTHAGEVRLSAARAAAPGAGDHAEAGAWLRVTVSDTGIGIAPEDQARLFRPFVQVDSSLARQYEGTGLGLSICRRLVEMMDGRITLESRPGSGSRFTVELPLFREAST